MSSISGNITDQSKKHYFVLIWTKANEQFAKYLPPNQTYIVASGYLLIFQILLQYISAEYSSSNSSSAVKIVKVPPLQVQIFVEIGILVKAYFFVW